MKKAKYGTCAVCFEVEKITAMHKATWQDEEEVYICESCFENDDEGYTYMD